MRRMRWKRACGESAWECEKSGWKWKKMGEKDGDAGNQRGKCISVEMTQNNNENYKFKE